MKIVQHFMLEGQIISSAESEFTGCRTTWVLHLPISWRNVELMTKVLTTVWQETNELKLLFLSSIQCSWQPNSASPVCQYALLKLKTPYCRCCLRLMFTRSEERRVGKEC